MRDVCELCESANRIASAKEQRGMNMRDTFIKEAVGKGATPEMAALVVDAIIAALREQKPYAYEVSIKGMKTPGVLFHGAPEDIWDSFGTVKLLYAFPIPPVEQAGTEIVTISEQEPLYYMRDNHTFLRLSNDPDEAMEKLMNEFDLGVTYGMLCTKRPGVTDVVHAHGKKKRAEFVEEARAWFAALSEQQLPNPHAVSDYLKGMAEERATSKQQPEEKS